MPASCYRLVELHRNDGAEDLANVPAYPSDSRRILLTWLVNILKMVFHGLQGCHLSSWIESKSPILCDCCLEVEHCLASWLVGGAEEMSSECTGTLCLSFLKNPHYLLLRSARLTQGCRAEREEVFPQPQHNDANADFLATHSSFSRGGMEEGHIDKANAVSRKRTSSLLGTGTRLGA